MGIVAVVVGHVLGVLSIAFGLIYVVRGAPLPGRAGMLWVPNSEEWRSWIAAAPTGYWRAGGVQTSLFGVAILLMSQGCFHHLLLLLGLGAFGLAVAIGFSVRARYGPFPRRSKSYLIRYLIINIAMYVGVQVLLFGGALKICL